ncbi:putative metal-dependent hydrolase domain protein [Rhodococcus sp. MTM3W5.2]|nr:putative metal-dependent hydrolase domain protein [Rhodococcus sp. MTM3W5.2]
MLEDRHVAADLTDAAERDDPQAVTGRLRREAEPFGRVDPDTAVRALRAARVLGLPLRTSRTALRTGLGGVATLRLGGGAALGLRATAATLGCLLLRRRCRLGRCLLLRLFGGRRGCLLLLRGGRLLLRGCLGSRGGGRGPA